MAKPKKPGRALASPMGGAPMGPSVGAAGMGGMPFKKGGAVKKKAKKK